MRLFLDANVLFTAAHNPNGKAALVIELGARGHWQLFSSPYAFEEARRNSGTPFPPQRRAGIESVALSLRQRRLSFRRRGVAGQGVVDVEPLEPLFAIDVELGA